MTRETLEAIEHMKQARMRIYEISQPRNYQESGIGNENVTNLAGRPDRG